MRVLGVARVSTKEQAMGDRFSIPHQRERITHYCAERRWELVDVIQYVHSGGTNFRQLQGILLTVTQAQIQVVVVNELDRLARDMVSTLLFLEDLQKVGCRFVAVSDDLDLTTADGELKMMILSVFAHYFRRQLSRKVKGGLQERARQGKHHGGRPPFGFIFAGDRLTPDPVEAAIVAQIYRWYVDEDLGGREIAKRLNERQVPTKTGHGSWQAAKVRRLLRRPANVGDLEHGAIEWTKERSGVTHMQHRTNPLVVRDAHPALVNRATWERAQALMAERARQPEHRAEGRYLLRGLVACGLCGRPMTPTKATAGPPRYICTAYQQSGLCSARHAERVPVVEQAVWDTLSHQMIPGSPSAVAERLAAEPAREGEASARQREVARLHRIQATAAVKRGRAVDCLVEGILTRAQYEAVTAKLDEADQRTADALAALTGEGDGHEPLQIAEVLRQGWEAVWERLADGVSPTERRTLVCRYVTRVDIGPDDIRVHFDPHPTERLGLS